MKKFIIAWEGIVYNEDETNFGIVEMGFDSLQEAKNYLKDVAIPGMVLTINESRGEENIQIETNFEEEARERDYAGSVTVLRDGCSDEAYEYKIFSIPDKQAKLQGVKI